MDCKTTAWDPVQPVCIYEVTNTYTNQYIYYYMYWFGQDGGLNQRSRDLTPTHPSGSGQQGLAQALGGVLR